MGGGFLQKQRESGWLEIGGYTLLGTYLLAMLLRGLSKSNKSKKEYEESESSKIGENTVNAENNEKEESVNVSSNTSMPFIYKLIGICVLSFILTLVMGIYLEKEWVVLKDRQNFVKNF